ncbi:membrane protein [Microbacterium phage Luna18]|nr:membrane protein [Microbacterium phage KatChan]URQ04876.1 membrane protein [Microbacterium phage Luna18]
MTKPIPVISWWERAKRFTVWHPINTDPDDEYRDGPRFWYPTFDLLMVALGVCAYFIGSPLLNTLFPVWFVDSLGVSIVISALLAAAGAIVPKLFMLEIVGKLALVFLLGGYAGTVASLSQNSGENWFVVITLFSLVWLLGPRLSWLFRRLGKWVALTAWGQRLAVRRAFRQATREERRRER